MEEIKKIGGEENNCCNKCWCKYSVGNLLGKDPKKNYCSDLECICHSQQSKIENDIIDEAFVGLVSKLPSGSDAEMIFRTAIKKTMGKYTCKICGRLSDVVNLTEWCPFCIRKEIKEPRLFTIKRRADESGVSGTGRVLDGIVFHNGKVAICWRTENKHGYSSVAVYDSFEAFKFIHIDSHPTNDTIIEFLN